MKPAMKTDLYPNALVGNATRNGYATIQNECASEISILSWNINGIGDKLGDPDVHKLIKDYSVIALSETMKGKSNSMDIPGYEWMRVDDISSVSSAFIRTPYSTVSCVWIHCSPAYKCLLLQCYFNEYLIMDKKTTFNQHFSPVGCLAPVKDF